jgi:hypothetical protein
MRDLKLLTPVLNPVREESEMRVNDTGEQIGDEDDGD